MNEILVLRDERVGVIRLNRPESKNSLSQTVLSQIVEACREFDADDQIGAIVILGSDDVFSSGGDLREMEGYSTARAYLRDIFDFSEQISTIRKPLVAGVNGYALGGGCELALACDVLVAGEKARFGLPEVRLGILPGMGGTQRMTRAVGKALAMDMVLTGRFLSAQEAAEHGLVSRLVAAAEVENETLSIAQNIANKPLVAVMMAKEAIDTVNESFLQGGLRHERRLLHALFATADQKEGMNAFLEKRFPDYIHE